MGGAMVWNHKQLDTYILNQRDVPVHGQQLDKCIHTHTHAKHTES